MKHALKIFICLLFASCAKNNQNQLFEDLKTISADKFEGRKPGTKGSIKAQTYLIKRLKEIGVHPFKESFKDSFELKFLKGALHGTNIQVIKKGKQKEEKYIVISAHYDHLGIKENEIYNGANDNATGVSVLLNLISGLKDIQTNHSIIYLFLDAEEFGKQGAKHFVSNNIKLHEKIKLNFNIDMLNCSNVQELYICGTKINPQFKNILAQKIDEFNINFGHDTNTKTKKSWLNSSDHSEFANWQIPFLYLGSENEENYNTPEDNFQNINLECFGKTLNITKQLILELDQKLD